MNAFQQPARVQIAAVIVGGALQQLFLLALELPQDAVNQAFQLWAFQRHRAFHGFGQYGVRRDTGIQQLIQADHQQIVQRTLFAGQRLGHQLLNAPFELRQHAQCAEAQFLQQPAVLIADGGLQRRQDSAERLPLIQHLADGFGSDAAEIVIIFHRLKLITIGIKKITARR